MKPRYFKLIGHKTKPVEDVLEFGRWYETAERRVDETKIGKVTVSTVFLGVNHQFMTGGPPILFETMVFGGPLDDSQERYSTWEEAEAGHAKWVQEVKDA